MHYIIFFIQNVFQKTKEGFKAATGKDVTLTIDTDYLPAEWLVCGGMQFGKKNRVCQTTVLVEWN